LGDSGVRGPEGPEGPQGPEGPEGPIGPRGNDGDPIAVLGEKDTVNDLPTRLVQDGDAYYVKATERLHIYYDGRWDISTPWRGLVGPEGPEGPQGLQGLQGTQGEQGIQGEVGPQGDSFDYDWNGTELGVRVGTSGSYEYRNLQGPQGEPGNDGTSVVIKGMVADASELPTSAENGDGWITNDDRHLHVWSEGSFIDVG